MRPLSYGVLQHDFGVCITPASVPPSHSLSSLLLLPRLPEASYIHVDLSPYPCFIPRPGERCRLLLSQTAYRSNMRRAFDLLNPTCLCRTPGSTLWTNHVFHITGLRHARGSLRALSDTLCGRDLGYVLVLRHTKSPTTSKL